MNAVADLVARVREHYVGQFRAFVAEESRNCKRGASEVKFQLSEQSELFQRLYCVDFLRNDEERRVIELNPDVLAFEKISGAFGAAQATIEHLRWDDVLIYHDLDDLPPDKIAEWFRQWFDPEDERQDQNDTISNVIHSLLIGSGRLSVDFGTSPTDAFWDLLELLERAGATLLRIRSSRAEAAPG